MCKVAHDLSSDALEAFLDAEAQTHRWPCPRRREVIGVCYCADLDGKPNDVMRSCKDQNWCAARMLDLAAETFLG